MYQHSQVAVKKLVADEKGHCKREGGSYLYIHLYYRSVVSTIFISQSDHVVKRYDKIILSIQSDWRPQDNIYGKH